jgi:Cysteine-rich CPXCG
MDVDVSCPSCGEPVSVWIDSDGGKRQQYVEDCAVCCRPMQVMVELDADGGPDVEVRSLDA